MTKKILDVNGSKLTYIICNILQTMFCADEGAQHWKSFVPGEGMQVGKQPTRH